MEGKSFKQRCLWTVNTFWWLISPSVLWIKDFSVHASSDGGDFKTWSRDGNERQASAVRGFRSNGETQTAVSGQRVIWYQRPEQVSTSFTQPLPLQDEDPQHRNSSPPKSTWAVWPHHEDSQWFNVTRWIMERVPVKVRLLNTVIISLRSDSEWADLKSVKVDAGQPEIFFISFFIPHIPSLYPNLHHPQCNCTGWQFSHGPCLLKPGAYSRDEQQPQSLEISQAPHQKICFVFLTLNATLCRVAFTLGHL